MHRHRPLPVLALALLVAACSPGEPKPPAPRAKPASKATTVPKAPKAKTAAVLPSEVDDAAKGASSTAGDVKVDAVSAGALAFVPRDAWAAVRIPAAMGLADAWRATGLVKTLDAAGLKDPLGQLESARRMLLEKVGSESKAGAKLADLLTSGSCELTLALLTVDVRRLDAGHECPLYAAAFVDAGEREQEFRDLLAALVAETPSKSPVKDLGNGRYSMGDEQMRLEFGVSHGYLAALLSPGDAKVPTLEQLFDLPPEESFATSDVVRSAPPPAEASSWLECWWNVEPMVRTARGLAPDEVQTSLDVLGADHWKGGAVRFALDGEMLRDAIHLVSPGARDLVSACFASAKLDPKFARYTMPDADDAMVFAFDVGGALKKVRAALPAAKRRDYDAGFEELKSVTGVDFEKDVLGLLGPGFAFSSGGMLDLVESKGEEPLAMALAIELKDAKKAASLVDMVVEMGAPLVPHRAGKTKYWSMAAMPPEAPAWLVPSFAIGDDALVIASTPDALEATLAAAAKGHGNARLEQAVAARPDGAFSVSAAHSAAEVGFVVGAIRAGLEEARAHGEAVEMPFALPSRAALDAITKDLPDGVRTWRATQDGLSYESRGPIGAPLMLMMPAALAASVAIPKLLEARNDANETAAIANLRAICSAQAQFQAAGVLDVDGDGMGEYGTFAQMSGAVALPSGEMLEPPVLSKTFRKVERGCVEKSGYLYRVTLPGRGGKPVSEMATGGMPATVDHDDAEIAFTVYAWPKTAQSGTRCFMVDQEGDVWEAATSGGFIPFLGFEQMPEPDSAYAKEGTIRGAAVDGQGMRRGPRGEAWRVADSIFK